MVFARGCRDVRRRTTPAPGRRAGLPSVRRAIDSSTRRASSSARSSERRACRCAPRSRPSSARFSRRSAGTRGARRGQGRVGGSEFLDRTVADLEDDGTEGFSSRRWARTMTAPAITGMGSRPRTDRMRCTTGMAQRVRALGDSRGRNSCTRIARGSLVARATRSITFGVA